MAEKDKEGQETDEEEDTSEEEPKLLKDSKTVPEKRDEEVDLVKACEAGREWMKKFVGNLNLNNFRIEHVQKNGALSRYIVIMSIQSDLGEEREYFVIKIDVLTGKPVGDIGKGKMVDEKITFAKMDIPKELGE